MLLSAWKKKTPKIFKWQCRHVNIDHCFTVSLQVFALLIYLPGSGESLCLEEVLFINQKAPDKIKCLTWTRREMKGKKDRRTKSTLLSPRATANILFYQMSQQLREMCSKPKECFIQNFIDRPMEIHSVHRHAWRDRRLRGRFCFLFFSRFFHPRHVKCSAHFDFAPFEKKKMPPIPRDKSGLQAAIAPHL